MKSADDLPYNDPRTTRRVALITGGNSGIGWFTVLHLFLHGYVVYVAGRNTHKVQRALKEVEEEALKRKTDHPVGELKWLRVDLLDLKSVRSAATLVTQLERRIDLLILNAGIGAVPYAVTNDGFEVQMQTNYISHVLFTQLLLPVLTVDSRVVYVSSLAHYLEVFQFNRAWTFHFRPNAIFTWLRYAMAKSAGIQYMKLLSMKQNLRCYSVHPGFVMNTNFFSYWTRIPFVGICFWLFFQVFGYLFGCTNEEGSYATLFVALSDDPGPSGSYYSTGGELKTPGPVANDLSGAAYSWIWTARELRQRGYEVD